MKSRGFLLALIVAAIAAFIFFDGSLYLQLDMLKTNQTALADWIESHRLSALVIFFSAYVLITACSLPGAAVLTLGAGALFGMSWGLLLVSFASSIGATLAMLSARFVFGEKVRDSLLSRHSELLQRIDAGIMRDGVFYLASLRLVPLFPFFLINLLMGLTSLPARQFYIVSQLAMLPGTWVYVNAGTQLAAINSLKDILSPPLLLSFTLVGVFPLLAKWGLTVWQRRRLYARWKRPRQYDYNLLVIGAGSAGLVSAYIASAVKAKVALIERERMGGDCLNTGCVPSKALIRSANVKHLIDRAAQFGIDANVRGVAFSEVMQRVQRIIAAIEPHDSIARYTDLGVDCVQGDARFISPWMVEVNSPRGVRCLTSRAIIIASGGKPFIPLIAGLDQIDYLTSDTVWSLSDCPRRLLILGGGPIGCELTQAFARLGAQVIQVEMLPRLLIREDPEISEYVLAKFSDEEIDVRLDHKAVLFTREDNVQALYCEHMGQRIRIEFDKLIVAVGRAANTQGLGLDEIGISRRANGTVETNAYLQTAYPNIYACGDVAGPYQFTHTAAHQAWYAAVNGLFGCWKKFRVDYSVIPWVTFTDPEVARVGLNETDACAQGIAVDVTRYGLDDLDRAITEGAAHGFIKVLTAAGRDRILGVSIVGAHAGELLAEFVLAMRHGIGLKKILGTIHVYPTWNEAVKFSAGQWQRAHAPTRLLRYAQRYHAWRRG